MQRTIMTSKVPLNFCVSVPLLRWRHQTCVCPTHQQVCATTRKNRAVKGTVFMSSSVSGSKDENGERLVEAAMVGDTVSVARLLNERTSPNYRSIKGDSEMTALMWAAAEGNVEIVTMLLDAGADVNVRTAYGACALLYAVENLRSSNPREAPPPGFPGRDALLKTKTEVPAQMKVYSKISGHPNIVRQLIEKGADVRIRNEVDETLLHLVTRKAQDGLVRELLAKGLDIDARSLGYQETALHIAAKESHIDVVSLLCELGADIEAKNRFGWTPLLWAAASGWEGVVKILIERGADVNVRAGNGTQITTPLKEARRCSQPASICNLLMRAGATE